MLSFFKAFCAKVPKEENEGEEQNSNQNSIQSVSQSENKNKCWLQAEFEVPDKIKEYITKQGCILPLNFHITLLYGYDEKFSENIINDVNTSLPLNVTTDKIIKGNVAPVCLLRVTSKHLLEIFKDIHKKYPNEHTLIEGVKGGYDPHITLFYLPKDGFKDFTVSGERELEDIVIEINAIASYKTGANGEDILLHRNDCSAHKSKPK
jgi:hypothetical protein